MRIGPDPKHDDTPSPGTAIRGRRLKARVVQYKTSSLASPTQPEDVTSSRFEDIVGQIVVMSWWPDPGTERGLGQEEDGPLRLGLGRGEDLSATVRDAQFEGPGERAVVKFE